MALHSHSYYSCFSGVPGHFISPGNSLKCAEISAATTADRNSIIIKGIIRGDDEVITEDMNPQVSLVLK